MATKAWGRLVKDQLVMAPNSTIGELCAALGFDRRTVRGALRWLHSKRIIVESGEAKSADEKRWMINPTQPDSRNAEQRWASIDVSLMGWMAGQPRYRLCEYRQWADI